VLDIRSFRAEDCKIPGPSHLEVEISIAQLKKYKSTDSDQISAELMQAGGDL
jgi:hypothetical protein